VRLAEFIDRYLQPAHVTLETGCGLSTLVILRASVQQHIAITPNVDEFEVIREFCGKSGLDFERLLPIGRYSQEYLPTADLPQLDLVLIDGDHSFPVPFIDWYYTADKLRVGGVMIVDDVHIGTGRILAAFMAADPKWDDVFRVLDRSAAFRKVSHPIHDDRWARQPYIRPIYSLRTRLRRLASRAVRVVTRRLR
ncbi:MAG TPA: class I SAM-dependent methyltransferase, partial [bacterium]